MGFRKIIAACTFVLIASVSMADENKKPDAMADAMKAYQAAIGGNLENVEVIGWRELAKLLPKDIDGMETGKIDGGTISMGGSGGGLYSDSVKAAMRSVGMGMSYSSAERTYTQAIKGGRQKRLTIRLMDSGIIKAMLAPFMMAIEIDTPDELLKSVEIAGQPAKFMQRFDDDLNVTETSYMILVKGRFLVQFEGNENVDPDAVAKQAKAFNYDKLMKLVVPKVPELPAETE